MNPFASFPQSAFEVISPSGELRAAGSGVFTGQQIVVFDEMLQVSAGDEIRRQLPNGSDETFEVIDPQFFPGMAGIPPNYQIDVRRKGAFPHHTGGHFNITVSGQNARVNIGSTDNSINNVNDSRVFAELIHAIEAGIEDSQQKAALIAAARDMQGAHGNKGFLAAYQKFIGLAADHIGVVSPFLAALGGMLAG